MDNNWRDGLDLVRLRNKALLARLFYRRTDAKLYNLGKTTQEIIGNALVNAQNSEVRTFVEANSEYDYRRVIDLYIRTSHCLPETMQAALDVAPLNGDLLRFQLCPDLLEGSSSDAIMFRIWILLESLYRMNSPTRQQIWPLIELPLSMIGTHPITINAVQQHLNLPPLADTLTIYLNVLIQFLGIFLNPHQPLQQPLPLQPHHPQNYQGFNKFQEELHHVVMVFIGKMR